MEINNYIDDLSWYKDDEIQLKAINFLSGRTDIDLKKLILPRQKNHWENAATVLCSYSDIELLDIMKELLTWLQDANWPGSKKIIERIAGMNQKMTMPIILDVLSDANEISDETWIWGIIALLHEIHQHSQESIT
ncbi:MAG: DUF5071 domain-containing protein [Clostridiales bacterium]|nr:DUF5071 domain-containing protein [Clostridiales bacterium]